LERYYAITTYDTTPESPFAVVRLKDGIFEIHRSGEWQETRQYDDILIGDFSDYEIITKEAAEKIITS